MGDDDDFVSSIDELGGQLVDVAFDSSWLWEEEVADHSDIVRHSDDNAFMFAGSVLLSSSV